MYWQLRLFFLIFFNELVIWDILLFFKKDILPNDKRKALFKSISKASAVLCISKSLSSRHEETARFICLLIVNYLSPDSRLCTSQLATEWKILNERNFTSLENGFHGTMWIKMDMLQYILLHNYTYTKHNIGEEEKWGTVFNLNFLSYNSQDIFLLLSNINPSYVIPLSCKFYLYRKKNLWQIQQRISTFILLIFYKVSKMLILSNASITLW